MKLKIVIQGITGRMGRHVFDTIKGIEDMCLIGGISRNPKSAQFLIENKQLPMYSSLTQLLSKQKADVLIDFSNADVLIETLPLAVKNGLHVVSGTTGIAQKTLKKFHQLALDNDKGIVIAPNFALGAIVLQKLAGIAGKFFNYVDVVETHHEEKKDSPSGTALSIAQSIADNGQFTSVDSEKETLKGTRGGVFKGINIHSVRLPGSSAHHQVVFGALGQTLTIKHDTISRECYMPGVVLAVKHVVLNTGLTFGLEKVLKI